MNGFFFNFILLSVVLISPKGGCSRRSSLRHRRSRNVEEGTVRLRGGKTSNEGNIEIFHVGKWGSICDDEWDIREAKIACKTLGYDDANRATVNGEFGPGRRLIWMDNLYCKGDESRLTDCRFDAWGVHDCAATEAAGVVCKPKNESKFEKLTNADASVLKTNLYTQLQNRSKVRVRLRGGRYPFEGRVEISIGKHRENETIWGLICSDGWSLLEATVVCKTLGFGYGQAAIQSSYFGGHRNDIIVTGIKCLGVENDIADCSFKLLGKGSCPGRDDESIAGVICAKELPDLVPDELELERSTYLEDRQLLFLQCAMEENCLASEAYKLDRNDYGWLYEQRRLLRFTARIGNIGTSDFRPFLPKHEWQWHMCHLHYHSMEVFAHFDIIDARGEKVAEGHKASFCLEDNNCLPGVEKKYSCANYGDQGISVGCSDTYLHNVDCQWVDITELKPGIYHFKVSINPEFKVAELNYENNAASCNLYYNAISVRVTNCTLQRP